MFFLQSRSSSLLLFNIGIIFSTFYSYFMLENMDKKELQSKQILKYRSIESKRYKEHQDEKKK